MCTDTWSSIARRPRSTSACRVRSPGWVSGTLQFVTRDRELSALFTHRLALSYERDVMIGDAGPTVRIAAALGGTYILYEDFVGLSDVLALDGTLSIGVEL